MAKTGGSKGGFGKEVRGEVTRTEGRQHMDEQWPWKEDSITPKSKEGNGGKRGPGEEEKGSPEGKKRF